MTSDAVRARNLRNARKSTGPRSAAGKAVVAGNARTHGATARPDPSAVDMWLAIILDKTDISVADLMPDDERGFRALALAEAAARVTLCEQALIDFEAGRPKIGDDVGEVIDVGKMIREEIEHYGATPKELRSANALLRRIERMSAEDLLQGGRAASPPEALSARGESAAASRLRRVVCADGDRRRGASRLKNPIYRNKAKGLFRDRDASIMLMASRHDPCGCQVPDRGFVGAGRMPNDAC